MKGRMALIEAKIDALLTLVLSQERERRDLARQIDLLFQSIESVTTGFEERARTLGSLNEELQRLQSGEGV